MRYTSTFLTALLVAVLLCADATAIAQQPTKTSRVVGKWEMTWRGTVAPTEFRADGTYVCDWVDGRKWTGLWWHTTDDELIVEETPDPLGQCTAVWTAKLVAGSLHGDLDGTDFVLKKP